MKYFWSILLLAALLAGCAPSESDAPEEGFTFTYNGCQIQPNAEASAITEALGSPKSYTEETSCAFEGLDKTYFYGSFYLTTYPLDGKDYVYRIWFVDDTVTTEEGLRIGNTQAEAEAVLGKDCFGGSNTCSRSKGNTKLTVILTDGLVSSIQYEALWE